MSLHILAACREESVAGNKVDSNPSRCDSDFGRSQFFPTLFPPLLALSRRHLLKLAHRAARTHGSLTHTRPWRRSSSADTSRRRMRPGSASRPMRRRARRRRPISPQTTTPFFSLRARPPPGALYSIRDHSARRASPRMPRRGPSQRRRPAADSPERARPAVKTTHRASDRLLRSARRHSCPHTRATGSSSALRGP